MATFEDIQKANGLIKTIEIKGKKYAEVSQRIKAFRSVHPHGQIVTDIISNENGVCIMRAMIHDDDGILLATGFAYEKEETSHLNRTSYIENCETSAVGRALGMCGFGIDTAVASADEVITAQAQKEEIIKKEVAEDKAKTEKVNNSVLTKTDIKVLNDTLKKNGIPIEWYLSQYKVKKIEDIKFEQYNATVHNIEKFVNKYKESCEEK